MKLAVGDDDDKIMTAHELQCRRKDSRQAVSPLMAAENSRLRAKTVPPPAAPMSPPATPPNPPGTPVQRPMKPDPRPVIPDHSAHYKINGQSAPNVDPRTTSPQALKTPPGDDYDSDDSDVEQYYSYWRRCKTAETLSTGISPDEGIAGPSRLPFCGKEREDDDDSVTDLGSPLLHRSTAQHSGTCSLTSLSLIPAALRSSQIHRERPQSPPHIEVGPTRSWQLPKVRFNSKGRATGGVRAHQHKARKTAGVARIRPINSTP